MRSRRRLATTALTRPVALTPPMRGLYNRQGGLPMRCPFCQEPDARVIDTRETDDGTATRRRRICDACGQRFTTYERLESISVMVRKRDGRREPLDLEKIHMGIRKACSKRPITEQAMADAAQRVEAAIRERGVPEVDSHDVGRLVMDELRRIDDVAYVRFASVYREFEDVGRFVDAVEELAPQPRTARRQT